jgi:enoyl-CoA hydratase/carnithine racemase
LTGRTYDAHSGQAMGLSHYLVDPGRALEKATELATRICGNAPLTNFAIIQALPRIAAADPASGYLTEALMSAIAQGDEEAKQRVRDFLAKRAAKFSV